MSHALTSPDEVTFVEKAQIEAENSPVIAGDARADELLWEARQNIYFWPADYPGFAAGISLRNGSQEFQGELTAPNQSKFDLTWSQGPGRDLDKWARYQIGELLAHRQSPEVSKMASRSGVLLGGYDNIYGHQLIFAGDRMQSYYRVKDRRITQISRSYATSYFIINIDSHHEFEKRFAASKYTAFYWDTVSGQLLKNESYSDRYTPVAGLQLPAERLFGEADGKGLRNLSLVFHSHRLLSPGHQRSAQSVVLDPFTTDAKSSRGVCPYGHGR